MAAGSASFARHEWCRRRLQISAYIFLTFILAALLCERREYDTLSTIKFDAGNCIASGRRIFRTEPSIYTGFYGKDDLNQCFAETAAPCSKRAQMSAPSAARR